MSAVTACVTTISRKKWSVIIGKKTWAWLTDRYHQPRWCDYPEALNGEMGCWALTLWPWKICRRYCRNCDFLIEKQEVAR